jgi:hypothetical protein
MNVQETIDRIYVRTMADGDCIRWTGPTNPKGYGTTGLGGRTQGVHRLAYELQVGPIPEGLEIDHLCRVRDCVRIEHLEAVTHQENVRRRMVSDVCPQGHPMTAENTGHRHKLGRMTAHRYCKDCKVERNRQWRAVANERRARSTAMAPVVKAAMAWRAMRADTPTVPKPESAALITAVDAYRASIETKEGT